MNNKERYDKYIEELNECYNKDEVKTLAGMKDALNRINNDINFAGELKAKLLNNLDKVFVGILCLLIILTGLLNVQGYMMYFFGLLFFFAGIFIGLFVKVFGIVFLFTHGLTGFVVMINSMLAKGNEFFNIDIILKNPLLRDGQSFLKTYLLIILVVIILAFISVILYNTLSIIKNKKYSIVIPFALFLIALLMIYLINPLFII